MRLEPRVHCKRSLDKLHIVGNIVEVPLFIVSPLLVLQDFLNNVFCIVAQVFSQSPAITLETSTMAPSAAV